MSFDVDTVVVGAGVIGLATARALALTGRSVLVLEAADAIGTETSSRNSEVIHAGLYYPSGSTKARTCVEGRRALYDYLRSRKVSHRATGKLVVATEESERPPLTALYHQALANGVEGLRWLETEGVAALEPELRAVAALWSPTSGIVDVHQLLLALQGDFEAAGGDVALRAPLERVGALARGFRIDVGGPAPTQLTCREVVNAAGLAAREVALRVEGLPRETIPPQYFAVGHYYTLSGFAPFDHLVYPVPVAGGLGIHLTLDLGGGARFGPDLRWIDEVDYRFDDSRRSDFVTAIRRYWPALDPDRLVPGYTGIRPKIVGRGEPDADFAILDADHHGRAGYVGLHGIESPGLTAALALADEVVGRLDAMVA